MSMSMSKGMNMSKDMSMSMTKHELQVPQEPLEKHKGSSGTRPSRTQKQLCKVAVRRVIS